MSRALTMDEAADALRIKRRAFQEIVKRYPFYYPNGRRKLFTLADVEAIRRVTQPSCHGDIVFRFLAERVSTLDALTLLGLMDEQIGSIYFVRCDSRIKIGYTTNWAGRFRILKTSCPHPVSVVARMPAKRLLETLLHQYFGDVRAHGEWFKDEGEAGSLIAELEAFPE